MLLDDMSDYLTTNGVSTPISKGTMLETPDRVIGLYETGGVAPVRAMGATAGRPVLRRPTLQVVCRAAADDYQAARSDAESCFALLEGLPTRSINGVAYKWGAARQEPFLFGKDEAGRPLVACNYDIHLSTSTT